jgi:phosphoribosyl-ATP pyrophosphohydrolase/phosphoribosyl-AMP cyclohydrolase
MTDTLNFSKLNGLVPAIVQDNDSLQVLMVGFMNREAIEKTEREGTVVFWSRTKQRLWQKGETSGNTLQVVSMAIDCDGDALLIRATPRGPVCHTGTFSCFGEDRIAATQSVFDRLEAIVRDRQRLLPEQSYTAALLQQGTAKIAQKVGEEAVEVVIASLQDDAKAVREESADLLYHLVVLLRERGLSLNDVAETLRERMEK